mmetsp:Transcript_1216/g.5267  ORF Transcript_1216/g.5267 Transcript_1216/m.5267 type:complete len:240 (-) Transcript_1216:1704-2423(-)
MTSPFATRRRRGARWAAPSSACVPSGTTRSPSRRLSPRRTSTRTASHTGRRILPSPRSSTTTRPSLPCSPRPGRTPKARCRADPTTGRNRRRPRSEWSSAPGRRSWRGRSTSDDSRRRRRRVDRQSKPRGARPRPCPARRTWTRWRRSSGGRRRWTRRGGRRCRVRTAPRAPRVARRATTPPRVRSARRPVRVRRDRRRDRRRRGRPFRGGPSPGPGFPPAARRRVRPNHPRAPTRSTS